MSLPRLSRRSGMMAAAGLGLVGLAGGLAWRTSQLRATALSEAEARFWSEQFVQVDGVKLAVSSFFAKPLVLNFWATWCPPCVEELPLLNAFFVENRSKGWQVLGLAVDQVVPVKRFLAQSPLDFPVALAGFAGIELAKSLGNLTGGLPFSVVFGASGRVLHRKMGRLGMDDLRAWAAIPSGA